VAVPLKVVAVKSPVEETKEIPEATNCDAPTPPVLEVCPIRYMVPDNEYVFKFIAVVEVDAVPDKDPWKVVAVILLSPIVIPEPVDNWVLPEAVLRTVPTRNLVAVDASVFT
jgi:hypothetical protein